MYLAGQAPGLWASNHLAEANQCTGWQFVAVRTLARMSAGAEVSVHEVVDARAEGSRLERRLRKARAANNQRRITHYSDRLAALARLKAATPTSGATKLPRRPAKHNDPLLRLMEHPNPHQSGSIFRFAAVQQLALTGSALLWQVKNEVGVVVELYVIPTGLAIRRLPTEEWPMGSYWITPLSTWGLTPNNTADGWMTGALGSAMLAGAEVDARDVKPVRWPHPLYLSDGLSPLAAIALWVDVANEMDRSCWYAMQNSERPGMVFEQDPQIDPDEEDKKRFREDLAAEHGGTPNTGKHLLLPKGIISHDRGRSPTDMDYANGRSAYRDMGLAAHAVSPIAAGISEAGSYAAYWAAMKQTTELAVQPGLDLLSAEITDFLGSGYPPQRREVNFKARAIDDPQLLDNRLKTDIQAGNVLLVKEYRALRGQPPLGDERDEEFVGAGKAGAGAGENGEGGTKAEEGNGKPGKKKPAGDKPASDRGSGTREEHRDAAPGRQDRNGKSLRNGVGRR